MIIRASSGHHFPISREVLLTFAIHKRKHSTAAPGSGEFVDRTLDDKPVEEAYKVVKDFVAFGTSKKQMTLKRGDLVLLFMKGADGGELYSRNEYDGSRLMQAVSWFRTIGLEPFVLLSEEIPDLLRKPSSINSVRFDVQRLKAANVTRGSSARVIKPTSTPAKRRYLSNPTLSSARLSVSKKLFNEFQRIGRSPLVQQPRNETLLAREDKPEMHALLMADTYGGT